MFDWDITKSIKTAGAFVLQDKHFAFAIGLKRSGQELGIVRLGGHVEEGESVYDCVHRELREEATADIELVDSPVTYYKRNWKEERAVKLGTEVPLDIKPVIMAGNPKKATAVFLAYAKGIMEPAAETQGIIFLDEQDIKNICSRKVILRDFINNGGQVKLQKAMDLSTHMAAGPHLKFLYFMMNDDYVLFRKFYEKQLPKI